MAKDFSKAFYKSKQWKDTRNAYYVYRGGWCEDCMMNGIYTRAEIIHHKVPLDPDNINNPNISLSFDNLKAVCRECHAKEHGAHWHRYTVDEYGHVQIK